jgi:hypothetical protein
MKPQLPAALCLALGVLAAPAAAQQGDFLTAKKIACVPDHVTRCSAPDKCETKEASARDKSEVLVIDFEAKKSAVRKDGKEEPFADIVEDKVEGDLRSFLMREPGSTDNAKAIAVTISKTGKLTLKLDGDRHRAEATCRAEG